MGGGPALPVVPPSIAANENLVTPSVPQQDVIEQTTMNHSIPNTPQIVPSPAPSDSGLSPLSTCVKPYWSTWGRSHQSKNNEGNIGVESDFKQTGLEEPLYTMSEDVVQRKRLSHQVQTGKPMAYTHKTASPKYMDSHDKPYAIFVFKYRSRGKKLYPVGFVEGEMNEA